MPADAIPPVDTGNMLLSGGPSQLTTALASTPDGQRLITTIRTQSATVTVFLAKEDVQAWAAKLQADADQMTGLVIVRDGTAGLSGLIAP